MRERYDLTRPEYGFLRDEADAIARVQRILDVAAMPEFIAGSIYAAGLSDDDEWPASEVVGRFQARLDKIAAAYARARDARPAPKKPAEENFPRAWPLNPPDVYPSVFVSVAIAQDGRLLLRPVDAGLADLEVMEADAASAVGKLRALARERFDAMAAEGMTELPFFPDRKDFADRDALRAAGHDFYCGYFIDITGGPSDADDAASIAKQIEDVRRARSRPKYIC